MCFFLLNECEKVVIQVGIREVVYLKDKMRVRLWYTGCAVVVVVIIIYYMNSVVNRISLVNYSLPVTRQV